MLFFDRRFWTPPSHQIPFLIDKVDAKAVQYQTPKHEIRKRPLRANATFSLFHDLSRNAVYRLRCSLLRGRGARWWPLAGLHSQRGSQDELANCRREAGEEGVERLDRVSCRCS
jgi:hypothetical protein